MHKYQLINLGIVGLLLPISAYAQEFKSRDFLIQSNPEAIKRLDDIKEKQQREAKDYLNKFLKCDGFSLDYGNVELYTIKPDGTCERLPYHMGGM